MKQILFKYPHNRHPDTYSLTYSLIEVVSGNASFFPPLTKTLILSQLISSGCAQSIKNNTQEKKIKCMDSYLHTYHSLTHSLSPFPHVTLSSTPPSLPRSLLPPPPLLHSLTLSLPSPPLTPSLPHSPSALSSTSPIRTSLPQSLAPPARSAAPRPVRE
jgi:hypothetical protein